MVGGRFYALGIGLACALLSGCASIKGAQDPLTAADRTGFVCPSQAEIKDFEGLVGTVRGAYRDQVIADCVMAINQHYNKYIADLRQESVSSNLTTDVLSLGLSGGATLAKPATAKALSASSAFVTGIGTSINKDVFYQQTLPAIVSAMDSRRASLLASILDSEKKDTQGNAYSLANAGLDIDAYQNAGNIYVAIAELTRSAQSEAQDAQSKVASKQIASYTAVVLDATTAAGLKTLTDAVRKLNPASDRLRLDAIATALQLDVDTTVDFEHERKTVLDSMTGAVEHDPSKLTSMTKVLKPFI